MESCRNYPSDCASNRRSPLLYTQRDFWPPLGDDATRRANALVRDCEMIGKHSRSFVTRAALKSECLICKEILVDLVSKVEDIQLEIQLEICC